MYKKDRFKIQDVRQSHAPFRVDDHNQHSHFAHAQSTEKISTRQDILKEIVYL